MPILLHLLGDEPRKLFITIAQPIIISSTIYYYLQALEDFFWCLLVLFFIWFCPDDMIFIHKKCFMLNRIVNMALYNGYIKKN